MEDPRERKLRALGQRLSENAGVEAERNALLREMAAARPKQWTLAKLASLASLTRGRVHQIVREHGARRRGPAE